MNKLPTLPIVYDSKITTKPHCISLYNVEFIEDFGVFDRFEKFSTINIDYALGTIYNLENNYERVQHFISVPEG